ncbi:phosphopantothenoylcysteine synthetase/decarboxylase [Candidatus Scalindua japonica]|uniref:Phosphopantothenoylcysteine synthetase/decarboxylase n=1 Tax=Candidatus Scalindua japonica TaxID=1284222 RepID=A0A286TWA8_9BACT|nr:hypothetical protein [Candidatus Scalindua japonica]GAX60121.1 phosphopantothenoylcysteine synthetase/decarboxylase [Candidatus Scalindua japonica]
MKIIYLIAIVLAIFFIIGNDAIFANTNKPGLEKTPSEEGIDINNINQKDKLTDLNPKYPKNGDDNQWFFSMIKHPLFILMFGSLGFPLILMYIQIRQKCFELKTDLVKEMSESVMAIIAKTDLLFEKLFRKK